MLSTEHEYRQFIFLLFISHNNDFDEHFWFITGLYFVMKSWKGDKPAMLADNLSDLSPNTAMELEKVVVK